MKGINHTIILLKALRTALVFISAFIIYDFLNELEKIWDLEEGHNETVHFFKKKIIKFVLIFVIDLTLLYFAYFLTGSYI